MAEYLLRLADIQNAPNLQDAGAKPGDVIIDNKLVRRTSTSPVAPEPVSSNDLFNTDGSLRTVEEINNPEPPTEAPESRYTITAEDIANTPRLQDAGATVGDLIEDNKLVRRTEQRSFLNDLEFGFDKGGSFEQYAGEWLESHVPLGRITFDWSQGFDYLSPTESYGEQYMTAPPEQRREILLARRELELMEEYGLNYEGGGAAVVGEVGKALLSPTTVIPFGGTALRAGLTGGTIGGSYTASKGLAEEGRIDPAETLLSTVAGAVLPAGIQAIGNKVATNTAIKTVSKIEEAAQKGIREGLEGTDLAKFIRDATGTTETSALRAIEVSGIKPHVMLSKKTPDDVLDEMITTDSATSRLFSKGLDRFLGILSTRIKNISEPIFGRLRKFEFNSHVKTSESLHQVAEFSALMGKLPSQLKDKVALHLFNGEFSAARALMKYSPKMEEAFKLAQKALDQTGDELQKFYNFDKIPNYFPRVVKNLEGLLNSMGREKQDAITRAWNKLAEKQGVPVSSLSMEDKTLIADRLLRSGARTEAKLGATKQRSIESLTPEQLQFYHTPEESIQLYVRRAVDDMETREFFGRALKTTEEGKVDVDASIGAFVTEAIENNNLTTLQVEELSSLISSRFKGGKQTPGSVIQAIKNLGYLGTIANPRSALTQLSDLGNSMALHGFRNTLASMFGPKYLKMIDLGLENVGAEMANATRSSALLEKMMKTSGFKAVDRLGKETVINAALRKNFAIAKTAKGKEQLAKKWKGAYGDDFDSLVADLQAGRVSENVKLLAFHELSDVQPISLSELPQAYLDNPNWRILYMLKSFTLKQYDLVRRNIVQEFKTGNKMTAIKNAGLLAGYMTVANTGTGVIKDVMLGREVKPEDLPENSMWALLGVFGANKYTAERYLARGDIKGAAYNLVTPATPLIDDAIDIGMNAIKGEDLELLANSGSLPVIGPMAYNWFGGGAEAYNERNK